MLKVKKNIYVAIPKNNEITKQTIEVKQAIQKKRRRKKQKTKQNN